MCSLDVHYLGSEDNTCHIILAPKWSLVHERHGPHLAGNEALLPALHLIWVDVGHQRPLQQLPLGGRLQSLLRKRNK